uniref:sn-1-specific diacylglycerol lipase ABHD11 n=3 Tax=Parascaris TaxID=6254 RepID=A0A915AII6_PARUN
MLVRTLLPVGKRKVVQFGQFHRPCIKELSPQTSSRMRCATLAFRCVKHQLGLPLIRFASTSSSVVTKLAYDKYVDEYDYGPELTVPLVMVHGLFGHKENWRSLAKALQQRLGNTVFTLDLRNHDGDDILFDILRHPSAAEIGYDCSESSHRNTSLIFIFEAVENQMYCLGDSPWTESMSYEEMANDVKHFLDEVVPAETDGRHTRVHLLGHSMGGKTAMQVALAKGAEQRLESLIVEDIAPKPYDTASHHNFPKYIETMKKASLTGSRGEISLYLSQIVHDVPTRQFLLTNLERTDSGYKWKFNLNALLANMEHICGFNMPKNAVFQRKCLFISGSLSTYVVPEEYPTILERFPKAEFSVIEGASHWIHADKPYPFMEKVVEFIESV